MSRLILAAFLAFFACVATAAFTVNGGTAAACTVDKSTPAQAVKCDLASIKTAGVYSLVMQVCTTGGIQNTSGGAVNVQAGCASSGPFSYELRTPAAAGPTLSVAP